MRGHNKTIEARLVFFWTLGLCILAGGSNASPLQGTSNPIVIENQKAGTNSWEIGRVGSDIVGEMKGYASATSVNAGENITFYVSVNPAQTYTIDIYRMGWYQGFGGRLIQHIGALDGILQPSCPMDATTGMVACNWIPSYTLATQTSWTSGIYLARLQNFQGYTNHVIFVVRNDGRKAPLLYQQPVNTYQAYNNYPDGAGKSLYEYNSSGANTVTGTVRAAKVSFDRPYVFNGSGHFFYWEVNFVRWLERSGYDVNYSTNLDTHTDGTHLLNYRGFLSVGHDEYWSKPMYDAAVSARDAGVNIAFFGADAIYWAVRFEPSSTGIPNRVMVGYKDAAIDPISDPTLKTVIFRDPPLNRPEQTLIGVQFTAALLNGDYVDYVVTNSTNWVYAGTGFIDGNTVPGLVGYEADRSFSSYSLPNALTNTYTLLSHSPITVTNGRLDYSNSLIYQAPSGAWVFGTGTIGWPWGLDNYANHNVVDARIQQMTANVLGRFLNNGPDFTLSAAPANQTVIQGGGSSYNITIGALNGFTGQVNLSVGGLPANASASFSLNPATSSSTLAVTTAVNIPTGTYSLTITGTSSGLTHTVLVTLVVVARAPGEAVYYVSVTGNDYNDGETASPWRTIQRAANAVPTGGTVRVNPGRYGERVLVSNSGSPGALLTFQAQGRVTMQGFNLQANYVRIIGFEIADVPSKGLFDQENSSGIHIHGGFNEVSGNYIHDTNSAGIDFSTTAFNNTIRSNRIVSAVDSGINVHGINHLIASNDISHTVQTHPGMTDIGDANGIYFFGSGSTFRKNNIHDITLSDPGNEHDPHIDAFQTWGPTSSMIIEQNTIEQMETPDAGITIEGRTPPVSAITIRNNVFISHNDGYSPAVVAGDVGPVLNLAILNNTVVSVNGPSEYAFWLIRNLSVAVVKNNAIYDHGKSGVPYIRVDAGVSGLDVGFNSISKSDGQPPAGSPYPNDLWMVDPQFVNFSSRNFHLLPKSPLTKAGVPLAAVTNDFDGAPRLAGVPPDIGAFRTNLPPTVGAGSDLNVTLPKNGPAQVMLTGTATDDGLPVGSTLTSTWSMVSGPNPVTFGDIHALSTSVAFATSGSYVLRLTASDGALPSSDDVAITVFPTLTTSAGLDRRVEATGPDGAAVELDGTTTGGDPNALTFNWTGPFGTLNGPIITPVIPIGTHLIRLVVTDPYGGNADATVTVTVQDTTPPVISARASPDVLWPPNHKLVEVTVKVEVSDIGDPRPLCSITGIKSNQPTNGTGDGNTQPDWIVTSRTTNGSGALSVQLRAERAGTDKEARIYRIQLGCTDSSGNVTPQTVVVTVPFDGKK